MASVHSTRPIFHSAGLVILWELAPEAGGRKEGVGREQALWAGSLTAHPTCLPRATCLPFPLALSSSQYRVLLAQPGGGPPAPGSDTLLLEGEASGDRLGQVSAFFLSLHGQGPQTAF